MSKQYREKMGEVVRLIINLIEKYPSTNGKVVVDHISNELDEDGWLKSYNTLLDTLLTIDEKQYSFGPQITYISKLLQAQAHSHESAMVSLQKIDTYTRLISKIAHTYTRFVNLSITTFQILDSEFIAEIESLDVEASQDVAYGAMRKTFHLMFIRIDEMSKDTPIINVTKSEEIKQILLEIVNLARKYTFITEKRREKRETLETLQLNPMQKCVKYTEDFKQCFMSLAGLLGQHVSGHGLHLIPDISTHLRHGSVELPIQSYSRNDFNSWWEKQMELKRYFDFHHINENPYRVAIVYLNADMFETVEGLDIRLRQTWDSPAISLQVELTQLRMISDIIYLKYELLSIQPNRDDKVRELENKSREYIRIIETYEYKIDRDLAYRALNETFSAIPETNIAYERIEAIRTDTANKR